MFVDYIEYARARVPELNWDIDQHILRREAQRLNKVDRAAERKAARAAPIGRTAGNTA